MYARETTFYLKIEKTDEAVDIYKNSIIPEAKKQTGFKGASLFINRNAGKFVSITIWENMEAAVANQRSGYYQKQIDKFSHIQIEPPEFESFDVAVIDYGN